MKCGSAVIFVNYTSNVFALQEFGWQPTPILDELDCERILGVECRVGRAINGNVDISIQFCFRKANISSAYSVQEYSRDEPAGRNRILSGEHHVHIHVTQGQQTKALEGGYSQAMRTS